MRAAAIVVNFNGGSDLPACVDALRPIAQRHGTTARAIAA